MAERKLELIEDIDAFGVGFLVAGISGKFSQSVHVQQPENEWAGQHVDGDYFARQRDALLRMLYGVYRAGREDMKAEFRELLEARPTHQPYGVVAPERGRDG